MTCWARSFPRSASANSQEAQKKPRLPVKPGPADYCCCALLKAAAYTAGVSPAEAAYSSPHIQSELVTDHLHFDERHLPHTGQGLRPCPTAAGPFEVDCRSRLGSDSHRCWDAGLSMFPLLPAAGLFLPRTPPREQAVIARFPWQPPANHTTARPGGSTKFSAILPFYPHFVPAPPARFPSPARGAGWNVGC
jgi:hypothetical protein